MTNFLIPILLLLLSQQSLSARFNGEGQPVLGPPNSHIRCDARHHGGPPVLDCRSAIEWIVGVNLANEEDHEAEQEGWEALERIRNTIVEFLTRAAERRDRRRLAVRTPKTWRFGECIVSVSIWQDVFQGGQAGHLVDYAAWRDVIGSASEIVEACLEDHQRGGWQLIGEHNDISVEVFAASSEQAEETQVDLGHAIPAYGSLPVGPVEPEYVDVSESDEEDQMDGMCFAGEGAGYSIDARSCCPGTKFFKGKMKDISLLLGVEGVSAMASLIGACIKT